jgi:hypothetical protein
MLVRITAVSCLLLLLTTLAPAALAQSPTATLSGLVTDPKGDAIDEATVDVTHKTTGAKRSTKTNGEGAFSLAGLPVGSYVASVSAPGFSSKRYEEVVLVVGQTVTLDVGLGVGTLSEVVDVDGVQAPLVQTVTSVVGGVVNEREIEKLPLNGRNFLELAFLIPGNAPAPNFDPTKTETVLISSAGHIGRGGTFTVDGADNTDDVVGGALQNISQEAVREFQMATNRFSAETGRSGSSVVNIVTKSGTNALHGSGSFFLRDDTLQGLPATADRSNSEDVPFDREHYAVAVGGPLVRDVAWWFGNFEYRNQDGVVAVGARDTATRTIVRSFAPAPLDDLMANVRADWQVADGHRLAFRYSFEDVEATTSSSLIRPIGSASERQTSENRYHSFLADWQWSLSERWLNAFAFSVNNWRNKIAPAAVAPQLTFPSLQDGASFRVPQSTKQNRIQISDTVSALAGNHAIRFGGTVQRVDAHFDLGVFQQGRIEYVEDFPAFDRNGDGQVNDDDLLFAVTLRSGKPDTPLLIPDADNWHVAFFFQDDWRVHPRLTLNLGVRYEIDTDVKNVGRFDEINPIVQPFLTGSRGRDADNVGPRIGFNWSAGDGRTSMHGGYGIYYDRVTLEIQSLERGLDGRALPIEVRAGNVFFVDPETGTFPPFAPTSSNPFTGFILPGAGASGINIIDNTMQNPEVQQFNLGVQHQLGDFAVSADYVHNFGTHFIIGRTVGAVFNPVVGGPDRVVNLESSVNHKYDGLLVSLEKRYADRYQFRASYTLSKAFNYANDDQIPFSQGPVDPNNLQLEYGPTPLDQRHRFVFSGALDAPWGLRVSGIWTAASGVPMDILLPGGISRIPLLQRNAGGRLFETGAELNRFIADVNAGGGIGGQPLPLVRDDARFNDSFNALDVRVSKSFELSESVRLEPLVEVFNVFNVTNVLGSSLVNYSGFASALVRDSNDPADSGYLRSTSFGTPVSTAGNVFGSGGPRAFQLGARLSF